MLKVYLKVENSNIMIIDILVGGASPVILKAGLERN